MTFLSFRPGRGRQGPPRSFPRPSWGLPQGPQPIFFDFFDFYDFCDFYGFFDFFEFSFFYRGPGACQVPPKAFPGLGISVMLFSKFVEFLEVS